MIPKKILEAKFRKLVEEDVGQGDVTTLLTVPSGTIVEARVLAKEPGVIAGIEEASVFLESFGLQVNSLIADGSKARAKTAVLKIVGDARTLLSIERTLLNLLSRMSGIATSTHRLVERVRKAGYTTRVACTRKVAPGLSYFDKRAVMMGGGDTHRLHLDDMILVKDNHLAIIGGVGAAVKRVREAVSFSKKVEVEVSTIDEALEAAKADVDIVMLDNFTPDHARKTIELLKKDGLRKKVLLESSGGITEKNILAFAAVGVDIISIGGMTASARALDLSLEIMKAEKHGAKTSF